MYKNKYLFTKIFIYLFLVTFSFSIFPTSVTYAAVDNQNITINICPKYTPDYNTIHSLYPNMVASVTISQTGGIHSETQNYTLTRSDTACTNGFSKTIQVSFVNTLSLMYLISTDDSPTANKLVNASTTINENAFTGSIKIQPEVTTTSSFQPIATDAIKGTTTLGGAIFPVKVVGYKLDENGKEAPIDVKTVFNEKSLEPGYFVFYNAGPGTYRFRVDENADEAIEEVNRLDILYANATDLMNAIKFVTGYSWAQDAGDKIDGFIKFVKDPVGTTTDGLVQEEKRLVGTIEVTFNEDHTFSPDPAVIKLEVVKISAVAKALSSAIDTLGQWVQTSLKWVMGGIRSLLEDTADYVIGRTDGSTTGMLGPWTVMRNIGLTLLVMALIIIAFANVLQIDIEQYGMNRMIPKIIISIILAFTSWLIVTFFFDFTKAIQDQAITLLDSGGNGGYGGLTYLQSISISTPSVGNVIANIGSFLLLIVILIGTLVCGVVLFFTLILRIVMLSFLLAVAPLAFILNIVPFTSNLYKQWWTEFWKWMFMGPIALVIIALGAVIAANTTGTGPGFGSAASLDSSMVSTDSGGRLLIGLVIFAAAMYMGATLPMKWGGKIMQSWGKLGKKGWGKTGAALGRAGWKATGAPNAYGLAKQKLAYIGDKNSKIRGNKIAQALSGGAVGIDNRAMKRGILDAEAQTYKKQFEQARVTKDELNNYAKNSKGPKAMGAWQVLQDKDWMPSDISTPGKTAETQSMWDKYYKDNGVEAGDSLYWGNRKKHPHLESVLSSARTSAGATSENPKLTTESLMGGMGDADYPEIEKDALKLRSVASRLALTERRADTLKPEQIHALVGNEINANSLKNLINSPGANGKSFKDGLLSAVDGKDSAAIQANLDVIRQKAARDFGDVSIQHLDNQSLLNLINKRF